MNRCRLLAEKVETEEMFEKSKDLGCTLFQGYFFAKPKTIASKAVSPLKINQLQLIRESTKRDVDFEKLATIIKNDVGLSYKTLRLVNSAYYGLQNEVKSINQALTILGLVEMRKWLTFSSMSELCEDKPSELVIMSLARANFCEQAAKATGRQRDANNYYLAGLFSLLDTLMDTDLEKCLSSVTIPAATKRALLEEGNDGRNMLNLIVALERGDWPTVATHSAIFGLDEGQVSDMYMKAIAWAQSYV